MNDFSAILDACILVPGCLCDTVLRFAESPSLYRPYWSEDILDEVGRTLQHKIGLPSAKVGHRIGQMRKAFPEATVGGYESLVDKMTNDPKDRHVLAAAVKVDAQAIVTLNRRHFGEQSTKPHGVKVLSPDDFLLHLFHLNPGLAAIKVREQAADIGREPDQILARLKQTSPLFADRVAQAIMRGEP